MALILDVQVLRGRSSSYRVHHSAFSGDEMVPQSAVEGFRDSDDVSGVLALGVPPDVSSHGSPPGELIEAEGRQRSW